MRLLSITNKIFCKIVDTNETIDQKKQLIKQKSRKNDTATINALANRLLSAITIFYLPKLINIFTDNVKTYTLIGAKNHRTQSIDFDMLIRS